MNVSLLAIAELCETMEPGTVFVLPDLEIKVIERTPDKVRISVQAGNDAPHIWWKPMKAEE